MNSLLKKYGWMKYVIGGFVVSLGILIIILACINMGQLQNVINIVIGSSLILFGCIFVCGNLFSETHKTFTLSLIIGTLLIAAGITVIVGRFHLGVHLPPELIVYFLAISLLALGAVSLFKAISLIYFKERPILIVLMFVVATLGIVAGILGLCFVPKLVSITYVILGIILIIIGIIYIAISAMKDKKAE